MEKKHWIKFEGQCGNETDITVFVPAGLTEEQLKKLEDAFENVMTEWGENNDGDYSEFDYHAAISDAFGVIGVQYEYPQNDHIIYI